VEFRGLMGGFYRISEWIMRLSVTNLLWLVTAFPVFFCIFNMFFFSQNVEEVQAWLLPIAVLTPFLLFPSTSAMFALARKWVMGDGDVPLFKTFFRSYKENYKQSMLGGIFYVVLLSLLVFNYQFYAAQTGYAAMLVYVFLAFIIVVSLSIFNFFCIVVHLHMKTFQLFKNALLVTVGQPFRAILIGLSCVAILYISFTQITFLIPFFMGSLIALVTFWHFHAGFRKIVTKHEAAVAKREEEAAAQEELAEPKESKDSL